MELNEIDLEGKSGCIFGLPDSGKSTLANSVAKTYGSLCIVYDPLREYPGEPFDSYEPKDRESVPELEKFVRRIMPMRKYRLVIIDECNRYCPSKPNPLPQAVADLNDWRAHYELGTIYICRRPVQLNQDLTDLAHYLFVFNMTGKHDVDYLNSIANGLGDACENLLPYHFVCAPPRRQDYFICSPVPKENATNKHVRLPESRHTDK